jgi:SAM-dependent methyltransferase
MKRHTKKEWFEDESFWSDLYPFMFPEEKFAAAAEQMDKLLQLVNPNGTAVLDLCCGPGRCAIPLARLGFHVTGVDRTRFLLNKARARARAAKARIEWVLRDMRDFLRPEFFHLALSMFTSFGYFDDKKEDIRVLRNIMTNLKPGGACLIEVMGKERLAKIRQSTLSDVLPDGTMLVQRHEIFDDWTRIRNEWTLIRKGRATTRKFHHTLYSGQELRDRMEWVGFQKVKLYGNLDGDEYGPDTPRLIAVGRKPAKPGGR